MLKISAIISRFSLIKINSGSFLLKGIIPPPIIFFLFFPSYNGTAGLYFATYLPLKIIIGLSGIILLVIIILLFLFRERKIKQFSRKLENELKERVKRINDQEKEIQLQKEEHTKQINLSDKQNDLIHKQTIELEKHRHHLEKIVDARTDELKLAKEKAEESDLLKTSFLENMSHEIRTPMNAIMGFATLLNDANMSANNKKYLSRIHTNCSVLLSLIDNILDMSKIQAGQMEIVKSNFSVNEALQNIYNYYLKEKEELGLENIELNLKLESASKDYILYSDYFRFKQIMSSLINNALKYTEKGSISFGYIPHFNSEYEKEPHMLQFFVEDTGIGIPSEKSDFIFDRFSKIENNGPKLYRGAGLGLYLSKHLVGLMGGKIWVHSRLLKGSAFNFTLPYFDTSDVKLKKKKKEKPKKKVLPSYDWRNKTILIVEDEQNNFVYLNEIIKRTGAKVLEAKNGKQSIESVENHSEINLVLMDIMMPGMDGYEATRKIKSVRPGLPVIAQTAYALAKEKKKSLESGCDGYISKPYDPPALLELINNFL